MQAEGAGQWAVHNRRRTRSAIPYEACALFLSTLRHRCGLHAVALGDRDGLVVSGAGEPCDLELLAFWGVLSDVNPLRCREEVGSFADGFHFFSFDLHVGGTDLRLSGVGRTVLEREDVEPAVNRILGPALGLLVSVPVS